ncbi:hypothetical protein [Fictibacillus gelatini]|uniref:hypothetical protein n=1 Tax=Fictibacillus gelatini TaxID=225985 RepID=UPI00040B2552|nr:hypothetical protein [Fictibacillus gelatini]HWO95605.1 hypothetical protein [Bacillus sp. (in: firmicutes)]
MKKFLLVFFSVSLIVLVCFVIFRPSTTVKVKTLRPTSTLGKEICVRLSKQSGSTLKRTFADVQSNLLFCENNTGVMPVLTNKELTEVKKVFHELDFEEFKEEQVENGYLTWQADRFPKEKFSMISGLASDKVKNIAIKSEHYNQLNRISISDNLWFWYVTFHKSKLKLPPKVISYDAKGHILGENE